MKKGSACMKAACIIVLLLLLSSAANAAHPLITDDTGIQGKGRFQIEINSKYGADKEKEQGITVKEKATELSASLSYGMTETVDIVLGIPYQWIRVKENGHNVPDENGFSDVSVEVKWKFYEKDGLSLGLKPGITLPTGDEEKGLGTGKLTYGLFFIGSKEIEPWAFHLNFGYTRNENKADERKDIWHASLAGVYEVVKDLQIVANIGMEKNPDKTTNTDPAFILGGIIYSISEKLDIDFGIKAGLNKPETDYAILAGLAWRLQWKG